MPDSLITCFLYYFGGIAFILFMALCFWLGARTWTLLCRLVGYLSVPLFLRRFVWRLDKRCTHCGGYPKLPGRPMCQPCSLRLLSSFGTCSEYTGHHTIRRPKGRMPD